MREGHRREERKKRRGMDRDDDHFLSLSLSFLALHSLLHLPNFGSATQTRENLPAAFFDSSSFVISIS